MHDLTAQVTSSLLPFPRVTIDALGEDEITLDSVLHGKFTVGKSFFYSSLISINSPSCDSVTSLISKISKYKRHKLREYYLG